MALITNAITSTIVAAAITVIPALFRRKSSSIKAKTSENGEKFIDYSKFVFWFLYGSGATFTILGILVYLLSDNLFAGMVFIIIGIAILLPSVLPIFANTTITWSTQYICGPKSGWHLKKHSILWQDVELAKYHPNHTVQIKDKSGRSVFWSVYYNGWHEIISDLRLLRPDIDTSDFD